MSRQTSIRNLQIITGLDSISYGLIYRFFPAHIQKLGGTQVTVGIFTIATVIGELLSLEITKKITNSNGKRYGLLFIFSINTISHILMVMTSSYWYVILIRILFSTLNQSQNFCLALLLDQERNIKTREKLYTNYSVLSGSGYILGPIIGGHLFDKEKGFRNIGMLAAFLTLTNMILLNTVNKGNINESNEDICENPSVMVKVSETVTENVENLEDCELEKNWDFLLLKYLFTSSILIFFTKFAQLLKHNYDIVDSVTVGYTIAYMNSLVVVSSYSVTRSKVCTDAYPLVFVIEVAFFLITVFMFLACYAPTYEFFFLLLIPITFLRTVIMTLWSDVFSERNNEFLNKLNNSAGITAGLTIPLLFGITCNQIQHTSVILFSCVPMLMCWIIIRFYSRFLEIDNTAVIEGDQCASIEKY